MATTTPQKPKRKSTRKPKANNHDAIALENVFSPLDASEKKKGPNTPTEYSDTVGERICALMMQGYTLLKICQHPNAPAYSTVMGWLWRNVDQEFTDRYRRAKEFQADMWADRITEIEGLIATGKCDVMRGRAIIDSISKRLAWMNPGKYSSRVNLDHSGEINSSAAERHQPDWIANKLGAANDGGKVASLLDRKKAVDKAG